MPLVATELETQLNDLAEQELSTTDANKEFAKIITDYIKSATVTVDGTGTGSGNMGAPVATVVTGTATIS